MSANQSRKTYEIRIVNARLGYANYPRPCIVTKIETDKKIWIYFLSTKNYSEPGQSFCIDAQHPDFAATGLKSTSFTVHPIRHVHQMLLSDKRGELTGQLAKDFEAWLE